jgi:hypothetical protein
MCAVTVIEAWPIVFCNNRRSAPARRASEAYVCGRSCTRRARRLRTRHHRDRRSTGGEQLRDRRTGAVTAVAHHGTGDTTGHGPSGTGSDDGNAHSALTTAQVSYRPDEDDRRSPSAALVAVYTSHGYRRASLLSGLTNRGGISRVMAERWRIRQVRERHAEIDCFSQVRLNQDCICATSTTSKGGSGS